MREPEPHGAVPPRVKVQGLGSLILTRDLKSRVEGKLDQLSFWWTEILNSDAKPRPFNTSPSVTERATLQSTVNPYHAPTHSCPESRLFLLASGV